MKFVFLGTGASSGVPVISCPCAVCKSEEKKNKRLRACGLLKKGDQQFLIDVSPDIRSVLLHYQIKHIDGIFITHPHEDHIGGMNDLRPLSPLAMVLSQNTMTILNIRFDYLLDRFKMHVLSLERGEIAVEGLRVHYFTYWQQGLAVTGFRFGKFAYVTDIKEYNPSIYDDLDGVETLVLGALHETESRMHFTLTEAVAFVKKIRSVKRCYFTHLSHEVEHTTVSKTLPEGIMLAYDGLEIDV